MNTARLTKSILTSIGILLATVQVNATAKEGGGLGFFDSLYTCTEKNPADPGNPTLAFLTKFKSGNIHLIIRPTKGDFLKDDEYLYSGEVIKNISITCFAKCDVYEDADHSVLFGVTNLNSKLNGVFEDGSKHLEFECRAEK